MPMLKVMEHRYLKMIIMPRTRPSETSKLLGKCFKNTGTMITVWGVTQHCMVRSVVIQQCTGKESEEAMKADEVDQERIRRRNERMTGKGLSTDQNKSDDVQTKEEKLDRARKETEEENQSEEIGSEQCVAPGDIQSNCGIPGNVVLDEDDKAAREESEHEVAVCTQKRRK